MAGHNKWSKVKNRKALSDKIKSKLYSKHAAVIAMESRKANGDLQSPGLAAAIARAKKESMPKDNIDRAVAKGAGVGGAAIEEVLFEGYGPGGVALLIKVHNIMIIWSISALNALRIVLLVQLQINALIVYILQTQQ